MPTSPIDSATVAQQLSGQFPAWRIWKNRGTWHARRRGDFHDLFGWRALRRADQQVVRAQSSPALAALLPFYGD